MLNGIRTLSLSSVCLLFFCTISFIYLYSLYISASIRTLRDAAETISNSYHSCNQEKGNRTNSHWFRFNLGMFFAHVQKSGGTTLRSVIVDKFIRTNSTGPRCRDGWFIQPCNMSDIDHNCPGTKGLYANHIAPSKTKTSVKSDFLSAISS